MEDPTVHVFSLNSKKSVLSDGSSIDAEEELVEISRPFNWRLNSKSLKQKKVILSEIIDVDMEEDCGKVKSSVGYSGKGKEILVYGIEPSKKKPNDVIIIDDFDNRSSLRKKSRSSCATHGTPNDEQHMEAVNRLRLFKKFDTVQDHSDHHYSKQAYSVNAPKNWAKKIQEEWRILEKDLPDTIFVRVYEARMDLLRAVIMGAEGTPYHDGLFFFDVFFPANYPNVPPHVYYHSFGLRLNPNLYACGKVCLSLLNTWNGSGKEKWIPGVSTMLQVLVSIQGLILNIKPYFNEPGYACTAGTPAGEESSLKYNESTYILNLKTMVYTMNRPPKHFEGFVSAHFLASAQDILEACKTYMDGVQVGSLVKGGIQDVDESNKSCSQNFKASLVRYIKTLIDTFTKIGAKDCGNFLYLAQK